MSTPLLHLQLSPGRISVFGAGKPEVVSVLGGAETSFPPGCVAQVPRMVVEASSEQPEGVRALKVIRATGLGGQ
jgi:hypothetical protein